MPQKVIEQNLGLKEGVITNQRTVQVAGWFIDLTDELARTAPHGSNERENAIYYRDLAKSQLAHYHAHRKEGDPERASSHRQLMDSLALWLRDLRRELEIDRPLMSPVGVPTLEQYESYVRAIMTQQEWSSNCSICGKGGLKRETVDEQPVCPSCLAQYTHCCAKCEERHITRQRQLSKLVPLIAEDGSEKWYCKGHTPKGTHVCDRCNNAFTGRKNVGSKIAAELTAQGVCACHNCAPAYQQLQCGHYAAHSGHNRPLIRHTEDDNRNGERLREDHERVCDKCREDDRNEIEHWPLVNGRLNGTIFEEVGSLRTFGVELEFCRVKRLPSMSEDIKNYWTAKEDGSLPRCGVEFASCVLQGDEGLRVIKDLCDYAEAQDWAVDARCGLHLHIGLTKDNVTQVASIAMGYTLTYQLWRLLVPPGRTINCKYCCQGHTSAKDLLKLDYNRYPATIAERDDRRVWCNWHSYKKHATVELRLHSGTRNYVKVANWVKAHARFCDWCAAFKDPKQLYERLKDYERQPRELLLILGQEAWKDRELARWFRERSIKLHGDSSPLQSHRRVRQKGGDPKAAPPPPLALPTYKGKECHIIHAGCWYIFDRQLDGGPWTGISSTGAWTPVAAELMPFLTQASAQCWLQRNQDKPAAFNQEDWHYLTGPHFDPALASHAVTFRNHRTGVRHTLRIPRRTITERDARELLAVELIPF